MELWRWGGWTLDLLSVATGNVLCSLSFFTAHEAHRQNVTFRQPTICQPAIKQEMCPESHNVWRVNKDTTFDVVSVYQVTAPIRSWLAVNSPTCGLFPKQDKIRTSATALRPAGAARRICSVLAEESAGAPVDCTFPHWTKLVSLFPPHLELYIWFC